MVTPSLFIYWTGSIIHCWLTRVTKTYCVYFTTCSIIFQNRWQINWTNQTLKTTLWPSFEALESIEMIIWMHQLIRMEVTANRNNGILCTLSRSLVYVLTILWCVAKGNEIEQLFLMFDSIERSFKVESNKRTRGIDRINQISAWLMIAIVLCLSSCDVVQVFSYHTT